MDDRIIEALVDLGYNKDWLLFGRGDKQIINVQTNNGIAGIQGNNTVNVNELNRIIGEQIDSKIEELKNQLKEELNNAHNNGGNGNGNENSYQGIGDITDSSLKDVNVSTLIKNEIAPLLEKMEDKIEKIDKLDLGKRISEIEELDLKGLRKCGWVLLIIIIVIAVLSVLALCMALPAFSADSMSFLGWTIAVLSMLVVVLMGWHIFNVLDLKEYRDALTNIPVLKNNINKIEKQAQDVKEEFGKQVKDVKHEFEKRYQTVENAKKDIEELKKVKEALEKINNARHMYSESRNFEAEGLFFERTNLEQAIRYYLYAIKYAVEVPDRVQALFVLNRLLTLHRDKNIKQICLSNDIILAMDNIKNTPNYFAVIKEFDEFVSEIYKVTKF